MSKKIKILITMGDPAGIGPNLCVLLAHHKFNADITVIGSPETIKERANILNKVVTFKNTDNYHLGKGNLKVIEKKFPAKVVPGKPVKENSKIQLEILKIATKLMLEKKYDALVTLPINKNFLSSQNKAFTGHTEFISSLCKVKNVVMMLSTQSLKVAIVTTHCSLRDVPNLITKFRLSKIIQILNQDLKHKFKLKKPKILVTGLNPHAGENGEFGDEEKKVIAPVINKLRNKQVDVYGPVSADTAFVSKNIKDYDAFLAMYHDQGLAPFKALSFGKGVNITLGLPFVRTSVDHGTAYDIVGTKKVDPTSFFEAIKMSIKLSS